MLLTVFCGVFCILVDYGDEAKTIGGGLFLGAHHAMAETKRKSHSAVGSCAHHHVGGIACEQGIATIEGVHACACAKIECTGTVGIEGIELGKGGAVDEGFAARDFETVAKGVGNHGVFDFQIRIVAADAEALTVVNHRAAQQEFLAANIRGVESDGIVGTVDIGMLKDVVERRGGELDALPLSRHTVVGQIVEHMVETIATKHNGVRLRAEALEGAIDGDACIAMEIKV